MIHLGVFLLILIATITMGITLILEHWDKGKILITILLIAVATWAIAEIFYLTYIYLILHNIKT